jgi:ABC-type siderophore export system fused ATPase/permease subunit
VKARSAIVYTVLRLLAFLVPFGILMLFPVMREFYWLAAIFAALIGLSLSLLFLRKPLDDVTAGLAERRAQARAAASDETVEDAAADAATTDRPDRS